MMNSFSFHRGIMTKHRFVLTLNCFLLISLLLTSCAGAPQLPLLTPPTPTVESLPAVQQAAPPALIETDPPLNTVIGHLSPITFYFNQAMNKSSVESAFSGLPAGTFTWNDDATLVFATSESYPPNAKLKIAIANSIQSAGGFGITEPIEISFTVADYLRATNLLPKANATDVDVEAAVAVSFNQPVVPLGADASALPPAFNIQPSVSGEGEWVNTSTYVYYPDPPMVGGTEYTISMNQDLKTVTGVGLDGSVANAWKFVTARPRVVSLTPSTESPIPLDPKITLTFNQPMDEQSVEGNFLISGTEGTLNGTFTWNENDTELTFVPDGLLARNVGYILNLGADARSRGGMTLGSDYGAVLRTFDNFAVTATEPDSWRIVFTFSAPVAKEDYADFISITPAVENLDITASDDGSQLFVVGSYMPGTEYAIELSGELSDQWGQALGEPFVVNYSAPPVPASLSVMLSGSNTIFVRPDEPVLYANAINVQNADTVVSSLSLQDFFTLQGSYELQQSYAPTAPSTFAQTFDLPSNQSTEVKLRLAQTNNQLLPGLYYVSVSSPQSVNAAKNIYFVASSQVNLTFKLGATEALVWAVDLPSQTPIADAPIAIYDDAGNILGSGTTDENGLWQGGVGERDGQVFAMLGAPGDQNFSLAVSNWSMGLDAWDFGYSQRVQPPHPEIYMYTDRPIYRPGQTVFFRGIVRQAFNGRYELPTIGTVPIVLNDANGVQLSIISPQLSPYGTFNGQFELSQDAVPGYYTFSNSNLEFYLSFQAAEYRKPESERNVTFPSEAIKLGDQARANASARYFFDAPAGNVDVKWSLYTKPDFFYLPDFQTGLIDTEFLDAFRFPAGFGSDYFGKFIGEGTAQTTPEGTLSISLPAIPESDSGQTLTLEVTATDETGLPVSARTELRVLPADFSIGIHPEQWFGTADKAIGFDVQTVDWEKEPSGNRMLVAEFKKVRWEKETDQSGYPTYTPVYTSVSSSNFATGDDGRARLSFVPPTTGTFMLDVSGGGAHTQALIWVGGPETAAWPDLPNQRLKLTANQEIYKAGDTAKVFIPNPFPTNSLALVSVERGLVSRAEVITLRGSGREYELPITDEDAPNVYLSVIVLGQGNDFRQGLVNIPVAPEAQELNVQVISNPTEAGPRDNVTFDVLVTDNNGQPVQGEFSLSVVDKAVLALADPNVEDILPAFYGNQPLGIQTGLSLSAYSGRSLLQPGGLGGGGGEAPLVVREEFPDTAYWNPSLITNSEGRGQVAMTLPDSLTTWKVDVRGLTADTKVGQAETEIVATKPLLIRPVTPRFLVSGDHVLMAAVVNNNTTNNLNVAVNLQSDGFVLDKPEAATRNFDISPNSQARVEWWGTAGMAESADLVFSVTTGGTPSLQDAARPVWGRLPILQYTAPQAFVTGGALRGAASQQEVISLPRTFLPTGGGLDLELSPSLAGSLLSALEAMRVPSETSSAETILSYILPNLEVYTALNNAGAGDPALTERVTTNLNSSVSRLLYLQNADGGWSWWRTSPLLELSEESKSDPYISAYVFFGLQRARAAGASVSDDVLSRAATYLQQAQPGIDENTKAEIFDTAAFIQFALSSAGLGDANVADRLYNFRDHLSPSGRAWLAYTINKLNPADTRVHDLISNLEALAILTSSSAHWETPEEDIFTRGSTIYTTSVVVYVLSQLDPANQVLLNAVRYLAAHRSASGLWNIGHDNAWAILALNAAMVGIGDLRADYAFNATLNGGPLTSGDIAGAQITPLTTTVPLEFLSAESPNLLTINREDGLGRLYYNVVLRLNRPVQDVQPLNEGMRIDRVFCTSTLRRAVETKDCTPLDSVQLASDQPVTARLTLVLPHDSYYVMVEDRIPAGMEVLNRNLKTSQLGIDSTAVQVQFDDRDPFAEGWGWWLFNDPQIRDEGILFSADFLPAGTYVLTYTLVPLQAGEFRVLPAHAWQAFFPEVQGTSAGAVFEIKP
ncbi:MAG: hypothetical protein FIB03_08700 [Anaerolineae bacterium]|nr:hypothetical protein [Anaerolineae bacterium]